MSAIIHIESDGWKSRLDEDFTEENVVRIADAAARVWSRTAPGAIVYVAYDARPEAERFACLVGRVLAGYGLAAMVSDRFAPTPALAWTVAHDNRACGGIMVTGSHNPYDYLGIKLYMDDGGIASAEFAEEIEASIEGEPSDVRGPIERRDIVLPYLDDLCALVDGDAISRAHLTVVVDPLYGSTRTYLPAVMGALGINVVEIHAEMDEGAEDMHPEPVEPWVDDCEQAVVEVGADAGLVNDGDGIRMAAVDGAGRFITPHQIIALLLEHLLVNRSERGRVVLGISSSVLARRVAKNYDCRVVVKPVGFRHIYKEMCKGDILLGAEEAGGIALGSHMLERDGLLAALLICELMAKSGKTLEKLADDLSKAYGKTCYARRDLRVEAEVIDVFRTMLPGLNPKTVAGREPVQVSHMDGLKLEFSDESWVLLRPSRTKPVVRVYAEAPSIQERDELLEAACDIARGEAGISGF